MFMSSEGRGTMITVSALSTYFVHYYFKRMKDSAGSSYRVVDPLKVQLMVCSLHWIRHSCGGHEVLSLSSTPIPALKSQKYKLQRCVNVYILNIKANQNDSRDQRWATCSMAGVSFFAGVKRLFCSPQHPDRLWSTRILLFSRYRSFLVRRNRPGRKAHHSPPSSVEVQKTGAIPPVSHIS